MADVDYGVKIRVKPDGSGVELANVTMSVNTFDDISVEEQTNRAAWPPLLR